MHSYYGLQTADLPWLNVVKRSCSNNLVMQRLQAVHAIIWDEASMSSQRVFELANAIHHKASPDENIYNPFAGKQIIVVGEFLQLRPVPNEFDEGKFMFMSSSPSSWYLLCNVDNVFFQPSRSRKNSCCLSASCVVVGVGGREVINPALSTRSATRF